MTEQSERTPDPQTAPTPVVSAPPEPALVEPGWERAREAAFRAADPLPATWLPLEQTVGETLAQSVRAEQPLPHFTSAVVDGWAVNGPGPWEVLTGHVVEVDQRLAWASTGEEPEVEPVAALAEGQAALVRTGEEVPQGTQSVVRLGWAREADGRLELAPGAPSDALRPDRGLQREGTEARAGETLLHAGTRLNSAHVSFAAVTGQDMLPVLRRPRVTLLLTGEHVVTSGLPEPGQVRDAYGPALPQFITRLGGRVDAVHPLEDADELRERLIGQEMGADSVTDSRAQLIITTGGTGRSVNDHLRPALEEAGAQLLIDGLDVRPGDQALLARMPDGGPLVLGLPGDPLAAMIALVVIGEPLLAGLAGGQMPSTTTVALRSEVPAATTTRLVPGLAFVAGAAVSGAAMADLLDSTGELPGPLPIALPLGARGTGQLRGLSRANVLLVVPQHGAAAGEPVPALPLPWL